MARKLALLVGVNQHFGGDIRDNDLKGCIPDVIQTRNNVTGITLARDVLVRTYGFKDEDIRMLTDGRAKKYEIFNRLKEYAAELEPGDLFVFEMSSHGTRYPIRLKDGTLTGALDCLCATDFTWDDPVLIGREIGKVFGHVPATAQVVFILDACHSGKQFRDLNPGVRLDTTAPYRKDRFVAPPVDVAHRFRGVGQVPAPGQTPKHVLLYSACDFNETAADAFINGGFHGAFTYHLWQVVGESKPDASYEDIRRASMKALQADGFAQNPGLEGDPAEAALPFLGGARGVVPPTPPPSANKPKPSGFFTGYGVGELPESAGFI